MRRRVFKSHRNYLIMGLCSILLIMTVGYAAFSTRLNITGSSKITSTWDVEITGIEKNDTRGNVIEKIEPSFTKDSATFSVGLELPGDYIYYKVAVTNKGTIAAIATLGNLNCTQSDALLCGAYADSNVANIGTNTDLTNRRLIIGPGETEYYNVWIRYNSDVKSQPDITNMDITLTLTYEQSDVGITHYSPDKCYTGKVLENGTIEITDYNEACGSDVILPSEIDGYTVTGVASGKWDANLGFISAFYNKGITSVTMPDTITYIGDNAFVNNRISNIVFSQNLERLGGESFAINRLTQIDLPESLKSIGVAAFRNNNLTEINIPSSVTYLGGGAFAYNNVPEENAIIYGRNSNGTIDYNSLNSYAGRDASNTTIPNVTTISPGAYRGVKFSTVILPETVEAIENLAFSGSQINTLIFNENLKVIGTQAFENNNLTGTLTIPNSVTTIGQHAFRNNNLETINIGSNITSIGASAFINSNNTVKTININKEANSISNSPWGAINAQINWLG